MSLGVSQVIRVREGNLYKLQGEPVRGLVYSSKYLCELWHNRMGNLHYKGLNIMRMIVIGLP